MLACSRQLHLYRFLRSKRRECHVNPDTHVYTCASSREIYQCLRNTNKMDIHCKLMKRYPDLPRWWFVIIFVVTLALSVGICQAINSTMQIPWWGVIVVTIIAVIVTLPLTIVVATTNQVRTASEF